MKKKNKIKSLKDSDDIPEKNNSVKPSGYILISPFEEFSKDLYDSLKKEIEKIFGYKTRLETLFENLDFAYDVKRKQYHSTPVLEKLTENSPNDIIKIIALTRVDLFIPILTHVYGEAQLGGKSCIVSTHRLNDGLGSQSLNIFRERVVKEAIHELGHTFDLRHCEDHTCNMHYCRSLDDVDLKSDQLCMYCNVLLKDEMKRMEKK